MKASGATSSRRRRRSPSAAAAALTLPLLLLPPSFSSGYATTHDLSHRHMAGIWRLTGRRSFFPTFDVSSSPSKMVPMKEFTVYPKKKPKPPPSAPQSRENDEEEVLLMLDEDGSFRQYALSTASYDDDDEDDEEEARPKRPKFGVLPPDPRNESKDDDDAKTTIRGTWDYLDGKLILAPDRPKGLSDLRNRASDTILEGEVVATAEERMSESGGPTALPEGTTKDDGDVGGSDGTTTATSAAAVDGEAESQGEAIRSTNSASSEVDVRLSIPRGTVATGKFMYPKTHPSFFEHPMHRPTRTGTFVLRQVLGMLNGRNPETDDDEAKAKATTEMFRREDLYGKTFFLTSHPLERRKPKGRRRWSIKYNKFVEDPPSKRTGDKSNKNEDDDDDDKPVQIRVMEVQFHANNTFSTIAGLGTSTILRGKFDVIGQDKDHLWMQVWRFGFGRSVSGSVYSEGMGLTHNDEKAYWGRITEIVPENELDDERGGGSNGGGDDDVATHSAGERRDAKNDGDAAGEEGDDPKKTKRKGRKLEIRGSVLDGWGLEPEPVARFTMMEKTEDLHLEEDEEDDDDDDEEEGGEDDGGIGIDFDLGGYDGGDGDDYSSPDAFQ